MQRKSERTEGNSRIDYGIIFCVLVLALIGLASIYVAANYDKTSTSVMHYVVMQLAWYVIGSIAIVIIMQFDSEQLWKIAPFIFGIGMFLMYAILIFYSRSYFASTGAKSWFAI